MKDPKDRTRVRGVDAKANVDTENSVNAGTKADTVAGIDAKVNGGAGIDAKVNADAGTNVDGGAGIDAKVNEDAGAKADGGAGIENGQVVEVGTSNVKVSTKKPRVSAEKPRVTKKQLKEMFQVVRERKLNNQRQKEVKHLAKVVSHDTMELVQLESRKELMVNSNIKKKHPQCMKTLKSVLRSKKKIHTANRNRFNRLCGKIGLSNVDMLNLIEKAKDGLTKKPQVVEDVNTT